MPDIMEISGLLSRRMGKPPAGLRDLRRALGARVLGRAAGKKRKKASGGRKTRKGFKPKKAAGARRTRRARPVVGPTAIRMLEIAEAQYAKGNKALALAWATRAMNRAKAEGRKSIYNQAEQLIKSIRGQAVMKMMAGLNDADGFVVGRLKGLW